MIPARLPDDEYDRLAELHDLHLLDTGPEARFDRITRLAQRTFGTPIVAFSLIDEDRQQFKSEIGLGITETPRDVAFCSHTILGDDVMVVTDASQDERFADNPLVVGSPDIAFYAGAPVATEAGHAVGTLCVIDTVPREWSAEDSEALRDLARLIQSEIGTRRQLAQHEALVALTRISSLKSGDPLSVLSDAIQIAAEYLDMPDAYLTRWTPKGSMVIARSGAKGLAELGTAIPSELSAQSPFHDTDQVVSLSADDPDASAHPLLLTNGLAHVLGVRLVADGEPFGTLSFTSRTQLSYGSITDEERDFVRLLGTWAEGVLSRWLKERALHEQRDLLAMISQTQSKFIGTSDRSLAFDQLLQDILDLTGCKFGFITERHLTPDARPYLRTRAVSNIAWNKETRELYEREHRNGLVFDNPHTLFGVTMMTGEIVIANDPRSDPRAGGRPGGHPPLDSYMGLPMHVGEQFVGVLGLANRPGGFDEEFAHYLMPLTTTLAQLITVARTQDERRADQQAIARLSAIATQMSSGVVVTDLEGRIEWTNDSFTRMFGFEGHELVGLRPRDVLHGPETEPVVELGIRDAMARREPFAADLQVVDRADRTFWVSVSSTLLRDAAGVPYGYVVLADDISERKRVERMKSEFISTISHELRTPLTSISGSLGLVVSGVTGELPERAQRMMAIALDNSKRLTTLINDLLDLERISEGGLPIDSEPHELMDIVSKAVEDNQAYAERFGCRLGIRTATPGLMVNVDSVRLIQVLSNLLSNAAKFSPTGSDVWLDATDQGGTVLVEVVDSGPGIPAHFRGRIFDRFAQADASDTRSRGGSGLGLAISRELVERMGGTIGYRSNDDRGSIFWFTLPVIDPMRETSDHPPRGKDPADA